MITQQEIEAAAEAIKRFVKAPGASQYDYYLGCAAVALLAAHEAAHENTLQQLSNEV